MQNNDVLTAIDAFEELLSNCDVDIETLEQMISETLYSDKKEMVRLLVFF